MIQTIWPWIVFHVLILSFVALDLMTLSKESHTITIRESLVWTLIWVSISLCFAFWIYLSYGSEYAVTFITGYLIEKALSVDNLFIFILIFAYFGIPPAYQHKILFWGILGALVMRALFILGGIALATHFKWILILFGIFLVITGIRMALQKKREIAPERNPLYKFLVRWIPVTQEIHGNRFFIKRGIKWVATPLFLALIFIEMTDVVFAIDSIPAIFAITLDPFIVYTSNIFAVIGLRSLYFSLSRAITLFHFLHYGLALILVLIGVKMLAGHHLSISPFVSLGVIGGILAISILASMIDTRFRPKS